MYCVLCIVYSLDGGPQGSELLGPGGPEPQGSELLGPCHKSDEGAQRTPRPTKGPGITGIIGIITYNL